MTQALINPNVTVETFTPKGELITQEKRRNLVTTSGLNIIRELLLRGVKGTATGYAPTNIALGDSSAAVTAGDTTLGSENYRDNITVRSSSNKVATFQLFLDADVGNGLDFSEAGLFDSPQDGLMFSRVTFTEINKTSSIQMAITWDINISAV